MSVATSKSQANEPIQLDIVIVCRKGEIQTKKQSPKAALVKAQEKISRLESSGFSLSKNDKKVIIYGQLLASLQSAKEIALLPAFVEGEMTGAIPLPLGI
jgi:putative DNA methylase